ncbi:hypothetical protein [Leptospira alexanderi]|uniref:hypothetical protein n=1 Tax=Leptospira alexanderi TaxID=100053 RepID=UPI0009914439|nr:hypothetical protein [Leptospira alexanderi]
MNPLQLLIGSIVKEVIFIEDYLQIKFTDNTIININNNFKFNGENLKSIEEKELTLVIENNSGIDLNFKGNLIVSISLLDEDYNCPEAIELYRKGKPPIIWD